MDMTLISAEPTPLASEVLLIVVGVLGFLALRRRRWTVAIIAPVVITLLWRLLSVLTPLLGAAARPDLRRYVLAEFAIGVMALLIGIRLPVLGWRHGARPAV
jgi:hypothetical protein